MKRVLLCFVMTALGVGCVYMLVLHGRSLSRCTNGNECTSERLGYGSLERLKARGVRSLTRLQGRLAGQIAEYPKQAAKLQPLHDGVGALKAKFEALEAGQSPAPNAWDGKRNMRKGQQRQLRYPEGSIEAIHTRGVRVLTMLELMIARRLEARSDQPEALLMSLKADVLALKKKFEDLRFSK